VPALQRAGFSAGKPLASWGWKGALIAIIFAAFAEEKP